MSDDISYNGIPRPAEWPPRTSNPASFQPMRVPYLENPPAVIPIDVGRQLFVDDFLIEDSNMTRAFHHPAKYPGNPVFFPQTKHELNAELAPCAIAKCGGLWHDERDGLFKMWYMASYLGHMAYATSQDGVHWDRPKLDVVPGTNLIMPHVSRPDSGTVWLDRHTKDESARFKAMIRQGDVEGRREGLMMTSPDGVHWSEPVFTGPMGDRSTMFHNPFRGKWVQSVRSFHPFLGRSRRYWEDGEFLASGRWEREDQPPYWTGADCMDETGASRPQLYNLDATPYESLMLGLHEIHKGPENNFCEAVGLPKLTELVLATSRDGFHWHRPDRRPFIGARREAGSWEYGYVEPTGGLCLVVGDELWFYYTAFAGDPKRLTGGWHTFGLYANGAVGLAKLRRDGFASMQAKVAGATLTTRPLRFKGDHLFVNANTAGAELTVEVLDEKNQPLPGFERTRCLPFLGNSTCAEIRWDGASLGTSRDRPVKLRFQLDRGELYAFWITDSKRGASHGHLAAGGPGLAGPTDEDLGG